MAVHFHEEDLPPGVLVNDRALAVDTETMGLITTRDRLCVVQLSDGTGDEHLVRFGPGSAYDAPNLKAVLGDPAQPAATLPRLRSGESVLALFEGQGMGAALPSARQTVWGLLNATTEFVDHHRRARSQDHRLDAAWFGAGAAIKAKAFAAAQALTV